VCGDDALAVRVIEELTTTYGEDVTVLLRSREAGQGPRIARMPKVRIIERAELDTSAFTAAGVQSARSLALLRQDDLGNFHAALRPGDQPRSAPRGLTTFLLSAANAGWMTKATGDAWLGYAFAYGGLAQLLAGMWEFRNRNVFGATAFGTCGGFWIGLALWALLVAPAPAAPPGTSALAAAHLAAVHAAAAQKDLGWILLAFAIFNTYMLLWSTQVNVAVFGVFLTLEATEIILFAGFTPDPGATGPRDHCFCPE